MAKKAVHGKVYGQHPFTYNENFTIQQNSINKLCQNDCELLARTTNPEQNIYHQQFKL